MYIKIPDAMCIKILTSLNIHKHSNVLSIENVRANVKKDLFFMYFVGVGTTTSSESFLLANKKNL